MRRRKRTPICPECGSVAVTPGANGAPYVCNRCSFKSNHDKFMRGGPNNKLHMDGEWSHAGGGGRRKPVRYDDVED